ncbi:succinate dehydrogenase/Fumarate reductase transmembrane subunit [Chlamydia ibidis]|uniref:Succinate dehydrogenase/Fumarate reductase transmembrane subunit n=2 Tax=Chlamydia ibidis TaxID=1405396 RepID=S7KF85_9CHLA|nr:succinate dehydrogenase cytochrome b558 subunit [Chlamydia ibidis]EPP34826.1 succinate dehydrogenase/Fumarate reductase transmembrane subunit [Chlamydia ibidis]EQM63121.1 succinate dehydrogenase/Fumarate reductase transmembrane subunit [Chlamydia ibidis 10-1398/6]
MRDPEIRSDVAQNQSRYYLRFILRCIHSLSGVAFSLFLCEHMFTNMLASSYFSQGRGFVTLVNMFHRVPYLKVIEVGFLALPFLTHAIIGIVYLFQGKSNSGGSYGNIPSLRFSRNFAYTWQRRTAWLLLFGLVFHVVQFRFIRYPAHVSVHGQRYYVVNIDSARYSKVVHGTHGFFTMNFQAPNMETIQLDKDDISGDQVEYLSDSDHYLLTPSSGTAFLYIVRDTLGSFWMAVLYTILVVAAAFHGFNGFWTFCSRWGIVISSRSQTILRNLCYSAMIVVAAMGVSVIWNLYSMA